jgi:hypothetical protein
MRWLAGRRTPSPDEQPTKAETEWPTDCVRVMLDFDDDGVLVKRRPTEGAEPTIERVDLNQTENGGTLVIKTSGNVGYVAVIQKWESIPHDDR